MAITNVKIYGQTPYYDDFDETVKDISKTSLKKKVNEYS